MINGLAILLLGQLLGEATARAFDLSVPGPVLGLVYLCAWLFVARGRSTDVEETAAGLLRHLSLLFVPASVGIVRHLDLLADHALAIGAALVVSTLATLVVTVVVFRLVDAAVNRGGADAP